MPRLAAIDLKLSYHKGEDDIAADFYLPCMERSVRYDRAVGFFSSSIYILAWPSLRRFVAAGGRMRLICSPVLSHGDVEALHAGYSAQNEEELARNAREEMTRLIRDEHLAKPTKVLATLIATGVIDLKIAWVGERASGRDRRLFHDKVGIFTDDERARVVFKGSMNETWPGLAADGNLESVDVYASWRGEPDADRVSGEVEYFSRLWDGLHPGVVVTPFPRVAREDLLDLADVSRWEEYVDEICAELEAAARWLADRQRGGRLPREHQVQALDTWLARGRRGILEHATGSGKTFTALCAIRDSFDRDEIPLILVPSELLLEQWRGELQRAFEGDDLQLLVCGGGRRRWADGGRVRLWSSPSERGSNASPRAVLAMMQTARTDEFLRLLRTGSHLFVVADEVHRLGSPEHQRLLSVASGPRLGLSATPRRVGDPVGTAAIFEYFEGVVPPPFTLADAISSGALTPYAYYPHRVGLAPEEQEDWDRFSAEIGRRIARSSSGSGEPLIDDALRLLLIRRARVAKKAVAKVELAARVLGTHFEPGQRWIVYCEDQDQLQRVRGALIANDLPMVFEYHSAMDGDATATLRMFQEQGGVTVAIRCLDEGVDIPAVSHALILASSRNPREFVQRRGRVLRRSERKSVAYVHDAVIVPNQFGEDVPVGAMLKGELARAIEFGKGALNPECVTELQLIAIQFDLDWTKLTGEGFEVDDGD